MVGTVIVFNDPDTGERIELDVVPVRKGEAFRIEIFGDDGKPIFKRTVTIAKANLAELQRQLLHIL